LNKETLTLFNDDNKFKEGCSSFKEVQRGRRGPGALCRQKAVTMINRKKRVSSSGRTGSHRREHFEVGIKLVTALSSLVNAVVTLLKLFF